jgi:hypothetical protein
MVTATTATFSFKGTQSGRNYSTSGYISDVVGAAITFSQNGAAASTSPTFIQFQEPVVLVDVAVLTGPTVATGWTMTAANNTIPSSACLISPNLTTNANRSVPAIGFNARALIGAVQF